MRNQRGGFGPRKMYKGEWECSDCKKTITQLPFKPDGKRPVRCKECYRKFKGF